jgi:hypothetical protein
MKIKGNTEMVVRGPSEYNKLKRLITEIMGSLKGEERV